MSDYRDKMVKLNEDKKEAEKQRLAEEAEKIAKLAEDKGKK
jgi:hypothetical protein